MARAAGWDARGIEPSERGVRAAREVHGVALERATVEDARVEPGSLDAVVLWHVLEHLDDPLDALVRVRGWLRPGGALLLGVPNVASWQARLGGARWYHLDAPRHRTHFTPVGLEALERRAGLRPGPVHHVLAEHNPFGAWQTLVNCATTQPNALYLALKRAAPLAPRDALLTAAALPLLPVAVLGELLAGLARRGGTIAAVAYAPSRS